MFEPEADSLMALLLDSLVAPEVAEGTPEDGVEPLTSLLPRPEVRAHLLEAIGGTTARPYSGFYRRFARLFDLSREAAQDIFGRMDDSEVWLPLGGTSLYHFEPGPRLAGAHAGLVRCQPGMAFPTHRHLGTETTLILSGSIVDADTGAQYLPGDVVSMPADTVHHLRICAPHECVFAVLMEGGFPDFD